MPVTSEIDPALHFVLNRATGTVTSDDLIAAITDIGENPRFEPHFKQLYDLRDVTDFLIDISGVQRLAAANPFGAGSRWVLLCGRDMVFGMARMYQMVTDNRADELFVTKDLAEALDWLSLTDEQAERVRLFVAGG